MGAGNPSGSHDVALPVAQFPIRRDAVAGGVFRRVRVVQIRHAFIPIVGLRLPRIRARHKGLLALDFKLRLEGVGGIRQASLGGRLALIHQKDGNGTGTRGNVSQFAGVQSAFPNMDVQPIRVRHWFGTLRAELQPQHDLVGRALPRLAAVFLGIGKRVIAPTGGDVQRLYVGRHQNADADGRRKEATPRRTAIGSGFFR